MCTNVEVTLADMSNSGESSTDMRGIKETVFLKDEKRGLIGTTSDSDQLYHAKLMKQQHSSITMIGMISYTSFVFYKNIFFW